MHLILVEDLRDYAVPDGVRVHLLTGRGLPKSALAKHYAALRLRLLISRLERRGRFDLVLSTLEPVDEIARLAELACWQRIAHTTSARLRTGQQADDPAKAQRRLAAAQARYDGARIIAISQGVADDLREVMQIKPAQLVVIPNPVDAPHLREAACEAAALPEQPYIVHAARFHPQKRHDLMLDAFAQLDVPGRLAMLTKPSDELRRMIRAPGLEARVLLPGFQPTRIRGSPVPACWHCARTGRCSAISCSKHWPWARRWSAPTAVPALPRFSPANCPHS